MKFGIRKPSLKRSIKARTTGRFKRAVNRSIVPGYGRRGIGLLTNPKKSLYNRIYHRTSIGLMDIVKKLIK